MNTTIQLVIMALLSLTVTTVVYPFVLRYALRRHIVDNPNARKVHRMPVPVMGGVAVHAGILAGCLAMTLLVNGASIHWSLMAITSMLVLGVWDDIKELSAILRLFVQFGIVGGYMAFTGYHIGSFHGFLGIHEISLWVGIPLTLVTGVGVINAINMIDGIDGYSSGYGIMACSCFAVLFFIVGQRVWTSLAVIVVGALIPFFMHNVFGNKSKMFIGDGGTMMIGFLMTIFILGPLSQRQGKWLESQGVSAIALTLAVLCIPVFDTLRVMTMRMLRGRSPFKPDKSHLHHLFIDMGFSHLAASIAILSINLSVIVVWLLLWMTGASVNVQTWTVALIGMAVTFGFYKLMRWQQHSGPIGADGLPQGTLLWQTACRIGRRSHIEKGKGWHFMQTMVDGRWWRRRVGGKSRVK